MPCSVCGAKSIASIGDVDVSSRNLCQVHTIWHYGLAEVHRGSVVFEAVEPNVETPWLNPQYGRAVTIKPTRTKSKAKKTARAR